MADSEDVMRRLTHAFPPGDPPEIIGIVVNAQGLDRALSTPGVTTIGYPYSISAYFRRANANMSRDESRALVEKLQKETNAAGRESRGLYFDGLWKSVRRALGRGNCRRYSGVAEEHRRSHRLARRYRWHCNARCRR